MDLMTKFMRRVSKPDGEDGCWLWMGSRHKRQNKNYGICWVKALNEQQAHRVSYILFKGPIPNGLQVLHTCDNPPCVNPNHLYAGTPQNNVDDRTNRGRTKPPKGENHGRAKLTEQDVAYIRAHCVLGQHKGFGVQKDSIRDFARRYSVTPRTIRCIVQNVTWKSS